MVWQISLHLWDVGWDVIVINDVEGVGTRYPLTSWSGARSDALAEST
jgi:hypothetical protein